MLSPRPGDEHVTLATDVSFDSSTVTLPHVAQHP